MSTANCADAARATNATPGLRGANTTEDWRGVKCAWTSRGSGPLGLAECEGLSDGLILSEVDADRDDEGERLGDSLTEIDSLGEILGDSDALGD